MGKIGQFDAELKAALEELLEEYLRGENEPSPTALAKVSEARFGPDDEIDSEKEAADIELFLETPCSCGRNCQAQFSADEVADARKDFRLLSLAERNSSLLSQLRSFSRASELSQSARTTCQRQRQRFDYRINADRLVCREVFLFLHDETHKRLKRLQAHLLEHGTIPLVHGNAGRRPVHACSNDDRELIRTSYSIMQKAMGSPTLAGTYEREMADCASSCRR